MFCSRWGNVLLFRRACTQSASKYLSVVHRSPTLTRRQFFSASAFGFSAMALAGAPSVLVAQESNLSGVARLAIGFQFGDGKGPVSLPVEVFRNLVLVEGRINGSAPLRFILDSGAASSIIDAETSREIGLKPTEKTAISGVTGTAVGGRIGGAVVKLPGLELVNHHFISLPLGELSAHLGKHVDGLLGQDLFSKMVVEMDYSSRLVRFSSPWEYDYQGQGDIIPLEIRKTPFVKLRLGTGSKRPAEGIFQIDTGFSGSIHVYRSFADLHRILEVVPKLTPDSAVGATGVLPISRGRIGNLLLGRFSIPAIIASFYPPSYSSTGVGGHDGNLGGEVLRRFKVVFDYTRRRLILEPSPNLLDRDENDMSGLSLIADGPELGRVRIFSVAPNSPADRSRLKEGDLILSVDGRLIESWDLDRISKRFKQDGTTCDLIVRRDNKIRGVRLRLSRLI